MYKKELFLLISLQRPSQDRLDDEELMIRHSEYHRPYESKIDTAMKSSDARLSSPPSSPAAAGSGAKQMTLAELARKRRANTETKDEPRPASSVPSLTTTNVAVEVSRSKDDDDSDSLVRHSEFYKGSSSPNLSRRKSAEIQTPLRQSVDERRPTLVDMLQKNQDADGNGNRLGSHLAVDDDFVGSRESIYSTDGTYSNNSVSGEILIGYQYVNGTFKVKIFEARGLTAIDKTKDTSDPYAKVYLLPDQSRAGKRKSKTKYGTLDPEFNEEMLYKISTNELVKRTIWVSLWNYDRFGRNEFLGEVRIPLGDYIGLEEHPKWHTLLEMLPTSTADSQGELVVGLMYAPADKKRKKGANSGKLYVKIVEGRNLPGKDSDNLSDPFCKSYLLPDPAKKTKKKTPVLKKNLNPHWDYKFSYDNLSLEELHNRVLELTVWDHDVGTNDFLGGVRIGLGTSDESWDDCEGDEVTLWQFLLSKPNTWTQSTLHLRNQMGSRKGLKT